MQQSPPPPAPTLHGSTVAGPALIPSSAGRSASAARRSMSVNSGAPPLTGANPWWMYSEGTIPGAGQYLVNVSQGGNLIIEATDMVVPHKGIPLVFRRAYNSLSQHDYFGSDGSQVSNYGASWTNSFDAHLAENSGNQYGQGISVFDVDGARYDYLPDGQGNWTPPAGQFATLTPNGSTDYLWTQKTGVVYHFYGPWFAGTATAGENGRLLEILGRNNNTYLTFNYYWSNGDQSCACNLTELDVQEEDGREARLAFSDFSINGQNQRLLSTLTWPNGTLVTYSYDSNGNLAEVDKPPANTYSTTCQGGLSSCVPQQYVYNEPNYAPGYTLMSWAYSPRLVMYNEGSTEPSGPSGTGVTFGYDLAHGNALVGLADYGYMNPSPPDGTGTSIQPGISNIFSSYRYIGFSRDYASTTNVWDSDNHSHTYAYDGSGRITEISAATGSLTLSTIMAWDTQNNLISTTDPRGNETDSAFDGNGNVIARALPSLATSDGNFRPTSLFSYDQYNNLTAACDPTFSHHQGLDWTSRPSPGDSLCPVRSGSEGAPIVVGSTSLVWASTANDLFGELQSETNAAGYTVAYSYAVGREGGSADYGLPTTIAGSGFGQYDNTYVQPVNALSYDAYGDILTHSKGTGAANFSYSYDADGRMTSATDGDGIQSRATYYSNGLVELTQTAAQYSAGTGVGYQYDADGNLVTEAHNFTCVANTSCTQGITYRWYDGADRLVEVSLPNDSTDYYPFPWLTRYIYDLSQGAQVMVGENTYGYRYAYAYGNLYKRQTCATAIIQQYDNPGSSCRWIDQNGAGFDGLDRQISQFYYQPGTEIQTTTISYDSTSGISSSPTLGLETSRSSAIGELTAYSYDAAGRVSEIAFTNNPNSYQASFPTPTRNYVYDASGRVESIATSAFGAKTYTYTPDGKLSTVTEPTGGTGEAMTPYASGYYGGSLSVPLALSYYYYPNGWRQSLSISSTSFNQNNMKQYSYRADGLVQKRSYSANGQSAWQALSYTTAGRKSQIGDMLNGIEDSYTYDGFGQLATMNTPSAAYSAPPNTSFAGIEHDLEGRILSYGVSPPLYGPAGPTTLTNTYNIRGELLSQGCQYPQVCQSAHGFLYPPDNTDFCVSYGPHGGWDTACGTEYTRFDARNGANLGTYVNFTSFSGPNSQNFRPSGSTYSTPLTYDLDGRELLGQFDMENHLTQMLSSGSTIRYAFGPDGKAVFSSYTNSSVNYGITYHWDGGSVLMNTDANGVVQDILFDKTANMTPASYNAFTFFDRDFTGAVASAHNATGYSGVGYPLSDQPSCFAGTGYSGGQANFQMGGTCYAISGSSAVQPLPFFWRTDGYFDGYTVMQGARSYDGYAHQWTSTDAYSGNLMDPMSEQPYVWNGNDPTSYVDPTGFQNLRLGGPPPPQEDPPDDTPPDSNCVQWSCDPIDNLVGGRPDGVPIDYSEVTSADLQAGLMQAIVLSVQSTFVQASIGVSVGPAQASAGVTIDGYCNMFTQAGAGVGIPSALKLSFNASLMIGAPNYVGEDASLEFNQGPGGVSAQGGELGQFGVEYDPVTGRAAVLEGVGVGFTLASPSATSGAGGGVEVGASQLVGKICH